MLILDGRAAGPFNRVAQGEPDAVLIGDGEFFNVALDDKPLKAGQLNDAAFARQLAFQKRDDHTTVFRLMGRADARVQPDDGHGANQEQCL